MNGIRNPILREFRAALVQSRTATGAVSRRVEREARMAVYRCLFQRHDRSVALRHVGQIKRILDDVVEQVGAG